MEKLGWAIIYFAISAISVLAVIGTITCIFDLINSCQKDWRVRKLWHPISEIPTRNATILLYSISDGIWVLAYYSQIHHLLQEAGEDGWSDRWEDKYWSYNYDQWCYTLDLV